jgi:ligand-binding sensor domain-containing protein/two-component sensor histidine kinase
MNLNIHHCFKFAIVFFYCCSLFSAYAQNPEASHLRFEHLGADQGFPQSVMTDIKQDKTGFIWIGTRDGVYRYDGYSFRSYSHPVDNQQFFKNQEIYSLYVSSDSTVWIGGANGLFFYDAGKENLVKLNFNSNEDLSFADETIRSVCEDKSKNLWLVTGEGELIKMNLKSRKPEVFFRHEHIQNVLLDHQGKIWLGTDSEGLLSLDPVTKKLEAFQTDSKNSRSISGNNIIQIFEDSKEKLWIATWSGLNRFDPSTKTFTRYTFQKDSPFSIGSNIVNCILEDHEGVIWAGAYWGGLNKFNSSTGQFTVYKSNPSDGQAIGNDNITCLFEDHGGVLWIGTNGGGLNKLSLGRQRFTVYRHFDPHPRTHYITCLYTSKDGMIWMGTLNGGFYCFNPSTKKFTRWHWDEYDAVKGNFNIVYGFDEATDGTIWVATTMEGLLSLNPKTKKVKVNHSLAVLQGLTKTYGQNTSVCADEQNKIWVGSISGLNIYDPAKNILNKYGAVYKDTNHLSNDCINTIIKNENEIWIGGAQSGLTNIDCKTGCVQIYAPHKNDADSASDDLINTIIFDRHKLIWLATDGGGLSVFDRKTKIFRTFTTADGLPSNVVKGLLVDDANNIWISTGNGISKCYYDPHQSPFTTKLQIRNYDIDDGAGSNDFSYMASTKGKDGTLYFGSLNGLVAFRPDSIEDNLYPPPVMLTEFLLNNKPVSPSTELLRTSVSLVKEIRLNYKQNTVGFTFAGLSYDHPEQNHYAYKLENFDKNWIYSDAAKRFANYTNLDPGKYVFKVKASNKDGVWNDKESSITIIITPPFWSTWWFYSLCAVFVAVILYIFYRYRLNQVLKLQTIRNNISSDLHDDIGSTLNSISVFSEVAKQQAKEPVPALDEIGISSRKIIDSMSDIVWTINPENDSFERIIQRMSSFAYQVLKAKRIEMVFKADESLKNVTVPMQVRKNFYLVFKEATNNIVKYSNATRASFQLRQSGKEIQLEIRDNGKGFDVNEKNEGNGLKNMRRRTSEIKAHLSIVSIINEGTVIEIKLKI